MRPGGNAARSYGYSAGHRALEIGAIAAFLGLAGALVWQISRGIDTGGAWLIAAGAAMTGYIAADLVSGIVHWLADTYGSPDTPLAGPNLLRPFREHHRWPEDIAHHDFVESNGNSCIVSAPAMAAILWVPVGEPLGLAVASFFLALTASVFGTNQFHKWAHMPEPPRVVGLLQRCRLILGPEHHRRHHVPPFDTYYCITTGWLNRVLAATGFWRGLEWAILRVTGYPPRDYVDGPAEPGPRPAGTRLAVDGSIRHGP